MVDPWYLKIYKSFCTFRPYISVALFSLVIGGGIGILFCKYDWILTEDNYSECIQLNSNVANPLINEEELEETNACDLRVDVSGAVNTPGVYCLPNGSNVYDAILKAGDINTQIYAFKYVSQKISLSKTVENQEKIYIPFQDDINCSLKPLEQEYVNITKDSATSSKDSSVVESTTLCVSLNKASLEELDTLDGVGVSTAEKIISGRPYTNLEQLKDVKGIGEATFDKLLSKVCL